MQTSPLQIMCRMLSRILLFSWVILSVLDNIQWCIVLQMFLLAVVWITAIPVFKSWSKLQCSQNTLAQTLTSRSKYTRATPILYSIHWLPVRYLCMWLQLVLILISDHSSYVRPFLIPCSTKYKTRRTRYIEGTLRFLSFAYPCTNQRLKQFGNSFVFDAPTNHHQ